MTPSASSPGLGELECLVMLAVMQLGEECYSVPIRKEITKRTGRKVSPGAVYVALQRLVEKGFLKTWLGQPTGERGGKARRHFRATRQGVTAVRGFTTAVSSMARGLDEALQHS